MAVPNVLLALFPALLLLLFLSLAFLLVYLGTEDINTRTSKASERRLDVCSALELVGLRTTCLDYIAL
ncbi:hypothetical protein ACEPAF_5072 [Sanghuangporus sanghuang]